MQHDATNHRVLTLVSFDELVVAASVCRMPVVSGGELGSSHEYEKQIA